MKKSMSVFFHSLKGRLSGRYEALLPLFSLAAMPGESCVCAMPRKAAARPFQVQWKAGELV